MKCKEAEYKTHAYDGQLDHGEPKDIDGGYVGPAGKRHVCHRSGTAKCDRHAWQAACAPIPHLVFLLPSQRRIAHTLCSELVVLCANGVQLTRIVQ